MQPASASDMQPAISLLEKTLRAYALHPHSGPFMKYSNPQP